uniref:Alpha/beta hydrolase fold-3 domain-containing protein n=1 Tax=Moschus moschiferus TaxID=68415 RepID=A0A8C6DY17_MOSMO
MGKTSLGFLILGIFLAAYIYKPLPDNVEEPWKIMLLEISLLTSRYLTLFAETLGLSHFMEDILFFSSFQCVSPTSDKNITVRDTTFNNIPVGMEWKTKSLRGGLFYVHGGGWCLGSNDYYTYDLLLRWTVNRLDAVIISTNYRLAPKYHFPVQFEDVYGVDPERIGISGDSAGGNLAAAVTQQVNAQHFHLLCVL